VSSVPISPVATALAFECCERIQAFHDAETRQLLADLQERGFSVRDLLAGMLTNAAHLSAHSQAKTELMAIGAAASEEIAVKAREKVRRYFAEHVPTLRDRKIDWTAEDLARGQG
jgi:hypothetical protein